MAGKKQKKDSDGAKKRTAPKRPAQKKPKKTPAKSVSASHASPETGGETFAQRLFRELQETETPQQPEQPPETVTETGQEIELAVDPEDDGGVLKNGLPISGIASFIDRLRGGILATVILLIIATITGFFFSDHILGVINLPFLQSGHKLNIFTVTGGFMIRLKASFGASVLLVFPFFVHRIWRVAATAIPKESRMFSRLSVIASILLFYSGIAFVYFLLMPAAVTILLNFIGGSMASTIGADDYLSFTILFSLAMGILFDTPIIVMILTYLGITSPKMLSKYRKHAIVIIWIIAALITPTPDPLTQSLVAVPLMLFFELSVIASRMVVSRKRKAMARDEVP